MHIAVFGTGGTGGYFGGRLAQAGEKVTFIARGSICKPCWQMDSALKASTGILKSNR